LAAVREPEWLKERRSDAARRAAELDLPRFKGKAGWEFTDITKLDLAAFTAAAPGEGDASAVDRVETLLEAPEGAHHLGQVDGAWSTAGTRRTTLLVLPLTLACETHADLVRAHSARSSTPSRTSSRR
jgi:Fe-S cluster assembly protein SufD